MVKRSVIFFFLVWSFGFISHAQSSMEGLMQKGQSYVEDEDYEKANLVFRQILTLDEVIPSKFCYYFAETLYHLDQYQNSKNFIEKYYELTDDSGVFYEQIQQLEQLVDKEMQEIAACQLCDDKGYRLEVCTDCEGLGEAINTCQYCKGKGKVACSICKGEGVLIKVNVFNEKKYHTCHNCNGSGIETCKICKGDKTIKETCSTCKGTGYESTNIICNHKDASINP